MQLNKLLQQLDLQESTDSLVVEARKRACTIAYTGYLGVAYAYILHSSLGYLDNHWINLGSDYYWTHAWIGRDWNVDILLKVLAPVQIIAFPILCVMRKRRAAWLAILAIVFLNFSTQFCYDESHSGHFLFWSGVFLCTAPLTAYGRWLGLRLAQIQVLIIYFLAGFWKFHGLFNPDPNIAGILQYTPYAVAQEYWLSHRISFWREAILGNAFLSSASGLMIVVLQTSALAMVFFPRLNWVFGISFVAFHLMTKLSLDIFFALPIPVLFALFILPRIAEVER